MGCAITLENNLILQEGFSMSIFLLQVSVYLEFSESYCCSFEFLRFNLVAQKMKDFLGILFKRVPS